MTVSAQPLFRKLIRDYLEWERRAAVVLVNARYADRFHTIRSAKVPRGARRLL